MKTWTYACLIIGVLFFVIPTGAAIPDTIELSTDTPWLTAGSKDPATITVRVSNSTENTPLPGVTVDLRVESTYGTISPARVVTDGAGRATALFTPGTKSGNAAITAMIPDGSLVASVDQPIDHAVPRVIANWWCSQDVIAGEKARVIVWLEDEYGNPVDNRNIAEKVRFAAGMIEGGTGGVFDGGKDSVSVEVDENGCAIVEFRVDTVAGENLIFIQPPEPIEGLCIPITGVGGVPSTITQAVVPASGSVPADGKTMISLTYTLFDRYGNPSVGQDLWVNATMKRPGQQDKRESRLLVSNSDGQVKITYGPEDSIGRATITATTAANSSVSVSQEVEFTSTEPVNMLLSASPQTMPSRDVNDGSVSHLRAKVIDERGNPVGGERVSFEIISVNCAPYVQTREPELVTTWAYTDGNGSAIVDFRPGMFTTDRSEEGWSDTATGTAVVRATWENVTRDIVLAWKNYPYLSVETSVSPETVAVDNTTDVTVRLRGDGWALQPDPIDVVLVIDRSGSMGGTDVLPTRMAAAKSAASDFVDQMNFVCDRVALVSFSFGATLDQGLTSDPDEIKRAINKLSPDGATNMRMAYYTAIKYLKENGRPDAVKAVILMGDGDWNYHGSPLAKGIGYADNNRYLTSDWYSSPYWAPLSGYRWSGSSYSFSSEKYEWYHDLPGPKGDANVLRELDRGDWYDTKEKKWVRIRPDSWTCDNGQYTNQNMSVYANSGGETNKVKIYSIGFASNLDWRVERDLSILSSATGGRYVWAGNEDDLRRVYTEIAGELRTEAGVDTKLDIAFENVEVNERFESGADVFDYVHETGVSTTVESWVDNETGRRVVTPKHTIDQTDDWNDDHNLHFDIGTMRLGQTWETTFRLKVLKEGNINIFGPGSTITFNNGTDTLALPDTFITAYPLNNTGLDFRSLEISNLRFTGVEPVTEFLPVAWDLNYTGLYTVTEDLFYSNNNGYSWVKFDTRHATNTTTHDTSTLDVRGLPAGKYIIRVTGYAPDTGDSSAWLDQEVVVGTNRSAYIQIQ
ncbi:Ig-like domain-containing protein [Methanoculleus thermophilus]|uniref:von Willebrand factor type A domain-containing protein n=1 Tax=Methanoculleus thermophilus TaxID=2200 RepID=A0A1G8ZIA4_9EURY|nr:VWA domain-containing protein [Methanoculleus thermophilus]SDK14852.1 von Willebrand factor type A domain-containing protein [Methanoculleus thermophilus]